MTTRVMTIPMMTGIGTPFSIKKSMIGIPVDFSFGVVGLVLEGVLVEVLVSLGVVGASVPFVVGSCSLLAS